MSLGDVERARFLRAIGKKNWNVNELISCPYRTYTYLNGPLVALGPHAVAPNLILGRDNGIHRWMLVSAGGNFDLIDLSVR